MSGSSLSGTVSHGVTLTTLGGGYASPFTIEANGEIAITTGSGITGIGVYSTIAGASIINYGTIATGVRAYGIYMDHGVGISNFGIIQGGLNDSGLKRVGGSLFNDGVIVGGGSYGGGVILLGGTITNNGLIGGSTNPRVANGLGLSAINATIFNNGTIDDGAFFNGTLINDGTISTQGNGAGDGVRLSAGTLINNGTILAGNLANTGTGSTSYDYNVGVYGYSGTIINNGLISGVRHSGAAGNAVYELATGLRVIVDPGGRFIGRVIGGAPFLYVAHHDNFTTVLELGASSTASTGTLAGALGSQYIDFHTIIADAGTNWTLEGADTVGAQAGLTVAGDLTIANSLTNDKFVTIDSGGTLAFDAGASLDNAGTLIGAYNGVNVNAGSVTITITNSGTIEGDVAVRDSGIALAQGGSVFNTGLITAGDYGVFAGGVATISNSGTIMGGTLGAAEGVLLTGAGARLINNGLVTVGAAAPAVSALTDGGYVGNFGTMTGGVRAISIAGSAGNVVNYGFVGGASEVAVQLDAGGTLNNAGTIDGGSYAAVVFNDAGAADRLMLDLSSTITGRVLAHGTVGNVLELTDNIPLSGGGPINRTVSGLGVDIVGFDSIQVDGLAGWTLAAGAGVSFTGGVSLLTDAQLTNDIRIAGTISGGVGDVVDNAGQVVAASGAAYAVVLNDGGSIVNSGVITGAQRAVDISGGVGTIDNSGTIAGGNVLGVQLGAGGTLVNGGSIGAGYYASVVFNSNNAARVVLDTGAQFGGRVLANGQGGNTVEFAAGSGTIGDFGASFMGFNTLQFDPGADWRVEAGVSLIAADTVSGLGIGATLVLDGFAANPASANFIQGYGLVLTNSSYGALFNIDAASTFYSTADFTVTSNDITDTTTIVVNCYGRGTRIETPVGDIEIEGLRVGDLVTTASGAVRPISWIGTRQFDPRFVGRNPKLLPIRICTDALADGVPRRDLLVSPEHAMLIDGVLVAARYLVNGVSIRQEEPGAIIDYFHIELASHDAVLAEGAAAETYVQDGDRGMFHNAADDRVANPGAVPPARYCAERIEPGPVLDAIRGRIDERAGVLAVTTNDSGLHLLVDGQMVSACEREDGVFIFSLPCGADEIVLASRIAEPAGADRRGLGVAVSAITIDGRPIDLPTLKEPGWHGLERNGDRHWRWTNGAAALPAMSKACRIEVTAQPAPRYRIHCAGGFSTLSAGTIAATIDDPSTAAPARTIGAR